jgi:hypothetical protein
MAAECRADNPRWSDDEIERWVDGQRRVRPETAAYLEGVGLSDLPWGAVLGAVRCPAFLALAGLETGSLLDEEGLAALRLSIPCLQAKRFAGTGHSVHRDAFVPYMKYLREFLGVNAR